MFRWAAGEELIPASIAQALTMASGVRQGRTEAWEAAPVLPVDDTIVDPMFVVGTFHHHDQTQLVVCGIGLIVGLSGLVGWTGAMKACDEVPRAALHRISLVPVRPFARRTID
jgi:hypothetical protein